jgi:hypothetical protein
VSIPRVKHALAVHRVNSVIGSMLLAKLFWTIKQASTKSVHNLELYIQALRRIFTEYSKPHSLVLLPSSTTAPYQACVTSLLTALLLRTVVKAQCLKLRLKLQLFVYLFRLFLCSWRDSPQWARASSFTRFLDHTQRRTTVARTLLDK